MGVGDGHFIDQLGTILEEDCDARAERFIVSVERMVAPCPFRVFLGLDSLSQARGIRAAGAAGRVAGFVVPETVLQGNREDIRIEWSSVSRLAFGSIFCGSLAPVPMT
jgi:hypothetical protein